MTKQKEFNYYESELSQLKPDNEYSQSMVISDGQGNKTKTLALNSESIPVLIDFLKKEAKRIKKTKKAV